MLQNETLYYITICYSLVTLSSVNHYICNVVNASFFLICVFVHIHITYTPRMALAYPLSLHAIVRIMQRHDLR